MSDFEFEVLDRRERALLAEADVLDKEFEEIGQRRDAVGGKLARIAAARATLHEILLDESGENRVPSEDDGPEPDAGEEAAAPGTAGGTTAGGDPDLGAQDPIELEEAQRRAVSLLATSGRKMRARAIAQAIGEDLSGGPGRVETTRGRLKNLVTKGVLEEDPPGVFFIATTTHSDDSEAEESAEEGATESPVSA
ncbi:hypothetical protein ACIBUY_28340 [Streptomyces sp. NPDC050085]|uniref:hypothetical protein n=1 Tax=Streptomyces sp. NPDC050085 TaxID=3365600 RepID=UPI00378E8EE7